jgi:peroxiredoxin
MLVLSISLVTACDNKEAEKPKDTVVQEEKSKENKEENLNNKEENVEEEIQEGIFPGDKAFDFTLLDREGNEISLSKLKGKVVFLNFWTSWCPACIDEMPYIQKVYEKYKDSDVVVLTVNITAAEKNGIKDTNTFLEKNNYTFPVLLDTEGEVVKKYRISGIPTTYIIDKDGIIVNLVTGPMNDETMIKQIQAAQK